jgi:hypothetical protein
LAAHRLPLNEVKNDRLAPGLHDCCLDIAAFKHSTDFLTVYTSDCINILFGQ